jgi:Sulfotransferase family
MAKENERTSRWTPPPRPDWVQRINEEGYCMNIRGVVPLDADSMIRSAIQSTDLSDFGSDEWREPFDVLVRSMDEDAALNLLGRIRTRSEILQLLCARLQVEDTLKRHPEILDEQIKQPLVIIGQGRSGTTYLFNVLGADPDNGVMRVWEAIFPCPPPQAATYYADPRIERGGKLIEQWVRVTPTIASMQRFAGDMPQECIHAMGMSFVSPQWFMAMGQAARYMEYISKIDMEIAYRYHRKVLQLLQWQNPRRNWVLKAPFHLDNLGTILKLYPDACLIWPHRDPVRALASGVNVAGTVMWGRSDEPFKGGAYEFLFDAKVSAARLDAVIDQIASGALPPDRVYNMLYKDLVGEPVASIEKLYAYFGIAMTKTRRDAVERYVTQNPREARPPHTVDRGSQETIRKDRLAYRRYCQYFGVPDEI